MSERCVHQKVTKVDKGIRHGDGKLVEFPLGYNQRCSDDPFLSFFAVTSERLLQNRKEIKYQFLIGWWTFILNIANDSSRQ